MLPYPSGEPHIGHLKNYSVGDAIAHFWRRTGHRVLHPMGYDAFGLPAENHAIKTGQHPRESTEASIEQFRSDFRAWGISIDWTREFGTHEPRFYRWTQWIFLRLFERGLAYRKEAAVKWCPKDPTVLANEQVIDGRCERCGTEVEARQLEQWFFRITEYADRLLEDMRTIEWPRHVVTMQENWIGRSEGAEVIFRCEELGIDYPVFTTRPDTLFGATFFVMAPEHPDVFRLNDSPEVHAYVNRALTESVEERGSEHKKKTGVSLGRTVTNPVTGEEIPMFVADYVLMEYGTGAIMAVPAHDERDYHFARTFDLPIRRVIECGDLPCTEDGPMVNSGRFDGLHNREAYEQIVDWLEADGMGGARSTTGCATGCSRASATGAARSRSCTATPAGCSRCPTTSCRWSCPDVRDYAPKGRSPLAAAEDWVDTTCPQCGGEARRETDTMDTFVDSSWYFLRYCDPDNDQAPFDREVRRPLDAGRPVHRRRRARDPAPALRALLRQGAGRHGLPRRAGAVRAALHAGDDPARRRQDVQVEGQRRVAAGDRRALRRRHGALLHPLPRAAEQDADWSDEGVGGVHRFLSRLWTAARRGAGGPSEPDGEPSELLRKAHWAIDKVTRDMQAQLRASTPRSRR